jgi:RNA polymerase sigma-70 factor (ECF subfamily)
MDAGDDNVLLAAIAQRRDREAADALYGRYERRVYGLAFSLTRDRTLAEEAVQEAFLKIWRLAGSYRYENARAWIFRIVAHESIRLTGKEKAMRLGDEPMDENEHASVTPTPVEASMTVEMQAALRRNLDALPEREREALMLHYGGGLTQEEIGRLLSLSQGVISRLMSRGLDRLRARLSEAGYAGVALPLLAAGIGEAACSGSSVPSGLHASVMSRWAGDLPVASSDAVRPRGPQIHYGWAVSVGVVVLSAVGIWWSLREPADPPESAGAAPESRPAAPLNAEPVVTRILDMPAPGGGVVFRIRREGGAERREAMLVNSALRPGERVVTLASKDAPGLLDYPPVLAVVRLAGGYEVGIASGTDVMIGESGGAGIRCALSRGWIHVIAPAGVTPAAPLSIQTPAAEVRIRGGEHDLFAAARGTRVVTRQGESVLANAMGEARVLAQHESRATPGASPASPAPFSIPTSRETDDWGRQLDRADRWALDGPARVTRKPPDPDPVVEFDLRNPEATWKSGRLRSVPAVDLSRWVAELSLTYEGPLDNQHTLFGIHCVAPGRDARKDGLSFLLGAADAAGSNVLHAAVPSDPSTSGRPAPLGVFMSRDGHIAWSPEFAAANTSMQSRPWDQGQLMIDVRSKSFPQPGTLKVRDIRVRVWPAPERLP